MPPAVRPTLLTTDGYGIFNVRTNLAACRTHEGGSSANKSAQELTRREKNPTLTLTHQGIESRVFGLEFRLTNHWATFPVSDNLSTAGCSSRPGCTTPSQPMYCQGSRQSASLVQLSPDARMFVCLLKSYSSANRPGSPQGFHKFKAFNIWLYVHKHKH